MDVELEEVAVKDVLCCVQQVVRLAAYLLHYVPKSLHDRLQPLDVRVLCNTEALQPATTIRLPGFLQQEVLTVSLLLGQVPSKLIFKCL